MLPLAVAGFEGLDRFGDIGAGRLQFIHPDRAFDPDRSHWHGVEQLQRLIDHLMEPRRWGWSFGSAPLILEERRPHISCC